VQVRGALVAACLFALAHGQQPPAFRSGVSLVTVDVTVLDADGQPVPGLTAADLEVRLNNRVQPIRSLEYLQVAGTMAGAVGPSFDAAPMPAAPGAKHTTTAPRVFVVLVDDLSFSPLAGKELFAAAQRFVSSLASTDVVGVTTSSGAVTANPTADRAPALAALSRITGAFQDPRVEATGPSEGRNASPDQQVGIAQAVDIDRGDQTVLKQAIVNECFSGDTQAFASQTLEQMLASNTCARQVQLSATRTAAQMKATVQRQAHAFEAVIRAMRGAPGIRHLVLLTDGIALAQDIASMQPVARAAAEAGVQLSVLMATPDISLSDGGRRPTRTTVVDTGAPQRRREDNQLFLNGARTTADMAGAEFYQVTGVPDRFFERVRTGSAAIYRLAVEVPADTQAGKDFVLAARVLKRQDVTARANRHAVAALPATASTSAPAPSATRALVPPAEQMRRAIASGRALNGVDVSIERSVRRAADPAQIAIDVVIVVSAAAKAPLATIFGLVDAGGAIRTSDKTMAAPDPDGGYRLAFSVPVAPGAYTLRFAAADADGAVGSIESAVDATLTAMGPFQASGIAIEPLPGSRRGILAAFELYPAAAAPPDVIVKMALVSGGDPVTERAIVPESIDGVLRAEAEFLLDSLPPATYSLRATVVSGTTVLGTATRPLK
jgi:hypothetical protein